MHHQHSPILNLSIDIWIGYERRLRRCDGVCDEVGACDEVGEWTGMKSYTG